MGGGAAATAGLIGRGDPRRARRGRCTTLHVIGPAAHAAFAFDPVERLIEVHRHSLALSRRLREAQPSPCPPCPEDDHRQCRIIINTLQREISRLHRGLADVCEPAAVRDAELIPSRPGGVAHHEKAVLYALRPGAGSPIVPPAPESASAAAPILRVRPQVTNLGTMLDVLA